MHTQYEFDIEVVDLYTLQTMARIKPAAHEKSGAAALVAQGFIGAKPISPSIAISIKTLELYRRLRLRKPSLSVEAFAKVICDYYEVRHHPAVMSQASLLRQIPYRRRYRVALADAFDAYLMILRAVDRRVRTVLRRDGPHARVLTACPPCMYKVLLVACERFSIADSTAA